MKAVYVVTESEEAAGLFKRVLPADLLEDTGVVSAGGRYAAFALAGTIMSERSRPVILIIDGDSEDLAVVREKEQTTTSLLLPAATAAPYKVCAAVPSIAALSRDFGDSLSLEQIQVLQQHPLIQQVIQFLSSVFSQAA
jgi:hypothetical protein